MFLMIINKSVPEISIPLLIGGAAALFGSICLAPMRVNWFQYHIPDGGKDPLSC